MKKGESKEFRVFISMETFPCQASYYSFGKYSLDKGSKTFFLTLDEEGLSFHLLVSYFYEIYELSTFPMNICSCILNAGLFMEVFILSFHQDFINRLVHHQNGRVLWQQARYYIVT